jgi:hypothetical protein
MGYIVDIYSKNNNCHKVSSKSDPYPIVAVKRRNLSKINKELIEGHYARDGFVFDLSPRQSSLARLMRVRSPGHVRD